MEGIAAVAAKIKERALSLNTERAQVSVLDEQLAQVKSILEKEAKVSEIQISYYYVFENKLY